MRDLIRSFLFGLVALILSGPSASAAPAEGEWALETSTGAAMLRGWGTTWWGAGAGLDAGYGLTDSWSLRFGAAYEILFDPAEPADPLSLVRGGLDLAWTFDVLRVVPYAFVGTGASALGSPRIAWRPRLELAVGAGASYLLSRAWRLGGEIRYGIFVPETASLPAHLLVSLLVSCVFF